MSLNDAQERTTALQAKLYSAAKREPKRRFYRLYDKLFREDVLWVAWEQVRRNRGAPGVDGVSIEAIEEAGVAEFLAALAEDLRQGRSPRGHPPAAGATSGDSESAGQSSAARHPHRARPGSAGRRQAGPGADLRGGLRGTLLRVPSGGRAAGGPRRRAAARATRVPVGRGRRVPSGRSKASSTTWTTGS
jgi:hypothetical protein